MNTTVKWRQQRFYVTKVTLRKSDDIFKYSNHKPAEIKTNYLSRVGSSTNHDQFSNEVGPVVVHSRRCFVDDRDNNYLR